MLHCFYHYFEYLLIILIQLLHWEIRFILNKIQTYSISGKSIALKRRSAKIRGKQTKVSADLREVKENLLSPSARHLAKIDPIHSSYYYQRYAGFSSKNF